MKVDKDFAPDDGPSSDRITYSYTADDKDYKSIKFESSHDETSLGEKFNIFYRVNNPKYHILIHPKKAIKKSYIGILISVGLFVLAIIILWFKNQS